MTRRLAVTLIVITLLAAGLGGSGTGSGGASSAPTASSHRVVQGQQAPPRDTAPARDAAAARAPTFRLRGRVLAADTGAPIRRAMVHISSEQLRDGRSMVTEPDGRYEFRDLPADSYYVTASKTGFMTAQPGSDLLGGDGGRSVKVGEGQGPDGQAAIAPDIVLIRACAIAGRVVDEFGDPVGNVPVRLIRLASGVRQPAMGGGFNTNDLGQYRASGLQPGTYFVFAENVRGSDGEIGDVAWYAPTYYPGTPDFSQAAPVQLNAGQEMTGADIMLTLVRTARVSGLALDSLGRPAADAGVAVVMGQPGVAGTRVGNYTRVMPNGSFSITGVPPGDYILSVRRSSGDWRSSGPATGGSVAPPRTEYGRTRITVAGSDLTGITVQMSPGATVSGQIVSDAATPLPKATLAVAATMDYLAQLLLPRATPGQVAADGTFVLTGVFGDRLFRISGLPSGWALKMVTVGGRDITDTPLSLDGREQLAGVQIVVTDRITHVTAEVTGEDGEPIDSAWVFIVPDDPDRSLPGSRFFQWKDVVGRDPAKIEGLPPGDYVAAVFRSMPRSIDVYEPDVLAQVRKTGVKFTLRDAETRDLTLKLINPAK